MSAERADRVAVVVTERELGALLVANGMNVRWLTGFTGTNGLAVVGEGRRFFVTDFRYVEQAAAQVGDAFEQVRGKQDLLGDAAERLAGAARVGFDDAHLTVRQHRKLGELLGDEVELVPAGGIVEELRAVKDAVEIERIRAAAVLADDALEAVLARGLVGRTERDVGLDLEREMRDRGAEGSSFPPIVAAGAHGALPHAEPRDEPIPSGTLIVIDWGAQLDGYCSDCTRTFATGPLEDDAAEVYELVRRAQEAALAEVRAGAGGKAVDAVAREIISEGGHGELFGHGLGHGVGLEVHEAPRLSPLAEGSLEAGMVVTVEPGVYVPERFGVRIEDLVVVGESGPEVLSRLGKGLVTIGAD